MAKEKQLYGVALEDVLQKRRLDQALNAKEFAVLAGISYSTARAWFRMTGFPVVQGFIFWCDFVRWRRNQAGLDALTVDATQERCPKNGESKSRTKVELPGRAAEILAEAG